MHSFSIGNTLHDIADSVGEHKPEIFLGLGLALVISAPVLAIIATKKAIPEIEKKKDENALEQGYKCKLCGEYVNEEDIYDHIEEEHEEYIDEDINTLYTRPITVKEAVKVTYKFYIFVFVTLLCGVGFICLSHKELADKSLLCAAALRLSEQSAAEYREHARSVMDEKQIEKVEHDISHERLKKSTCKATSAIETGHGNMLFFDAECGRKFRSDAAYIERMMTEFNNEFLHDIQKVNDGVEPMAYKCLEEFYELLDLPESEYGKKSGWLVDDNTDREDRIIKLYMTYGPDPDTGEPCGIMRFNRPPVYVPNFRWD